IRSRRSCGSGWRCCRPTSRSGFSRTRIAPSGLMPRRSWCGRSWPGSSPSGLRSSSSMSPWRWSSRDRSCMRVPSRCWEWHREVVEALAMETARIAEVLDEMGTMLELRGENPFRCRAYHTAAQALLNLSGELSEMIADGRLAQVPGIGETMHAKIVQLSTTGQLPAYEELRRRTPPGLVALLRVPGLGPKKIKALHEELRIETIADLRAAAES